MAVVLALVAAGLFALGTVLQQRAAVEDEGANAEDPGFLVRLARQPRWLLGIAFDGLGFVCQAAALSVGRLVVVQPLLATSVVFALPISAVLGGQRVGRRDALGALAVTGGLAVFLLVSNPAGGRDDATAAGWLISGAVAAAACAALVLVARGRGPARRAALLGIATGIAFGFSALLTKAVVERIDDGLGAVVGDWHLYALIVVGYVSLSLSQASLATGVLAAAVATQMALDPVTSLLLGTLVLGERLHESTAGVIASLAGFAAMVAGLIALAAAEAPDEPTRRSQGPGVAAEGLA